MIRVEVNNGAAVLEIPYTDGMTVQDLIVKIQDYQAGKHLRLRSIEVYDPSQNQHKAVTDEIVDDRLYMVQAWVQTVVDDSGNPIKSGLV